MYAMYASASVAGYAMIIARYVPKRCKGKSQLSCGFMIKQNQYDDEEQYQVMQDECCMAMYLIMTMEMS